MQSATSIDTRLVLRVYSWVVLTVSIVLAEAPQLIVGNNFDLPGIPYGRAGLVHMSFAAIAVFGFAAVGMSRIESPASRQRALWWFAIGHLYFGLWAWG